jgi:hypothetical protein
MRLPCATRGEVTALIHQTLVTKGKIEPVADNLAATQYIVRASDGNQNAQEQWLIVRGS